MATLDTWKKLLIQAFNKTAVITNQRGKCGIFNIRKYIYLALENAGIENRSPISLKQLVEVRVESKGHPEQVHEACIRMIEHMQKPALGFNTQNHLAEIFGAVLVLIIIVTPQTATTFRAPSNGLSILKQVIQPVEDIDWKTVNLPIHTDYLNIAGPVKVTPEVHRDASGLADKSWILQQKDSAYSLQILSASNSDSLQTFCKKHDICQQSAFYQTQVNGKPLSRMLYGIYTNHKAARAAKEKLPEELKKLAPWARKLSQIKQEI